MNHTDLATSRRLAKVWPLDADDRQHLQWLRNPGDNAGPAGEWCLTEGREAMNYRAWGYDSIPARDLAELEARVQEMELGWISSTMGKEVRVWLYNKTGGNVLNSVAVGGSNCFINALGAAVAAALEAREREEKP